MTRDASWSRYFAGWLTLQSVFANPVPSGYPTVPIIKPGELGAVASESDVCSHIGTDLLKLGGNAADAMVGTVACVGVIGMYHSGKSYRKLNYRSSHTNISQASEVEVLCLFEHQTAHTSSSISAKLHQLLPLRTCTRTTRMLASTEV